MEAPPPPASALHVSSRRLPVSLQGRLRVRRSRRRQLRQGLVHLKGLVRGSSVRQLRVAAQGKVVWAREALRALRSLLGLWMGT